EQPMPTIVKANKQWLVAAFLAKHFGGVVGCEATEPLPTQTTRGTQTQLVAANLVHLNNGHAWSDLNHPMRTAMASGNHAALVCSFLVKYFGTAIGQPLDEPMHTVTTNDRFGLVIVKIFNEPWVLVDILMRMLVPRELARAQVFPDSYKLVGSKTAQTKQIGNSVPPEIVRRIIEANMCRESVCVA